MSPPSPAEQVVFLANLQRLLHEGSTVSTYKFALLRALAEVCVEEGDDSGEPMPINTRALAERFVRSYWKQTAPYQPSGRGEGSVLLQNTKHQATIVRVIGEARATHGTLVALRRDRKVWTRLVKSVATTIEKMPLWKLQTVGGSALEFLYPNTRKGNEVVLKPGVAFCFRLFHEFVEDLVLGAWLRFVRELPANRALLGQSVDLGAFLFDTERASLKRFATVLTDEQKGECFYCAKPLRGEGAVDHFIPWSRYPVDLGHNFVLAHARCNGRKGDRLAAFNHLARWCERNETRGKVLAQGFDAEGLAHDLGASGRVTRWAYTQADTVGALVWRDDPEQLVPLDLGWRSLPLLVA